MTRLSPATASCHAPLQGRHPDDTAPLVALVGAPNAGKSTLFNAITGARITVGNWPGTTVEVGTGSWPTRHGLRSEASVLDLPGAYSLDPLSPDEALTRDLIGGISGRVPDLAVVAVDAANLARSLYLVAQLRELPLRVVVCLTMVDIAARRGVSVSARALATAIGCPVVPVDPRRRTGLTQLGAAVQAALDDPVPRPRDRQGDDTRAEGTREPAAGHEGQRQGPTGLDSARPDSAGPDRPVVGADLASGDDLAVADERFAWIETATETATEHSGERRVTWSDRVDRWVTAPVVGPLIFLVVMWVVFQVTTTVAAPLQELLGSYLSGPVTDAVDRGMAAVGLADSPIAGFVTDGLIAGVGMLLTFVPLMALMFLLLAVLEDSGYMARAAVVTDRLMRRIGLPGKAFLPLVVGFGCNVPAISATRILGDARHRLLVSLLVPFTSCTARLTVYVMLATIFFPDRAGTVVFAMYVVSVVLVVVIGMALRATLWRTMGHAPLVLDLPPYQRPTVRLSTWAMWQRLKGFLRTASGVIVATVAVVWLLQATPVRGDAPFGHARMNDTAYAAVAQSVTPVFGPTGFGEWETTSALMVGFVAKEAVVSSWAQTYATAEPDSGGGNGRLADAVRASFERSSAGHPGAAVLAFLVFLLAYTPCVATLSAQHREIGTRWTLTGMAIQLVTAWTLAVAIFQIGRLLT